MHDISNFNNASDYTINAFITTDIGVNIINYGGNYTFSHLKRPFYMRILYK